MNDLAGLPGVGLLRVGLLLSACAPLAGDPGASRGGSLLGCETTASIPIHDIQGWDAASPLEGETVDVTGVVTARLDGSGFFLQAETDDDNPLTSEGLFVAAERAAIEPGLRLHARGTVRERDGSTELHAVELIEVCGRQEARPMEVMIAPALDPERWESMWITSHDTWTLIDASDWRGREVTISSGDRIYSLGHELGAVGESLPSLRWRLQSTAARAPDVDPMLAPLFQLARGARTQQLTGVVELTSSGPVLRATHAAEWRALEARAPEPPGETVLRVAALNVDNYFAEPGGRLGATSELELSRQRAKLVAALSALNADILALTELGNSGASVEHLASGLNESLEREQHYSFSSISPPVAATLRAALFYRPARVAAEGEAWFDVSSAFRRPPLFQSFRWRARPIAIGVVHLKSKRCEGELAASELEGCGAVARAAEARELALLTADADRISDADRLLLVGDFNADALEPPLRTLAGAGFFDLLDAVPARKRYSYVFDGRASLLDHILSPAALAPHLVGAAIWHINADQPSTRGYELENPPAEYRPDALRSSDHDPVSIDLSW